MTQDDKKPKKPAAGTTTQKHDAIQVERERQHTDRTHTVIKEKTQYVGPWHTEASSSVEKVTTIDHDHHSQKDKLSAQSSRDVVIHSPAIAAKRKAASIGHKSVKPVAAEPQMDTLTFASEISKELTDIDLGVDARSDAALLFQSAGKLRQALASALPGASALQIKGLGDANALALLIHKDYAGTQEVNLKLNYTDHQDKAFNDAIGQVPVNHGNILKVAAALDQATAAIKGLKTELKPGATVTQNDILLKVNGTLKRELEEVLVR